MTSSRDAQYAQQLHENPLLAKIVSQMQEDLFAQWVQSDDPGARERLHAEAIALREIYDTIRAQVANYQLDHPRGEEE